MSDKLICDGCNRILERSELAGKKNVTMHGKVYGENVITLLYCSECWEKKKEEEENGRDCD